MAIAPYHRRLRASESTESPTYGLFLIERWQIISPDRRRGENALIVDIEAICSHEHFGIIKFAIDKLDGSGKGLDLFVEVAVVSNGRQVEEPCQSIFQVEC